MSVTVGKVAAKCGQKSGYSYHAGMRARPGPPVTGEKEQQYQCLRFRDAKSSNMLWPHRYY